VIQEDGPAHSPTFKVSVKFDSYQEAEATSGNIKDAEKKAAVEFIKLNKLEI
jgi:dsRNA-specific ribonuclease